MSKSTERLLVMAGLAAAAAYIYSQMKAAKVQDQIQSQSADIMKQSQAMIASAGNITGSMFGGSLS